MAQEAQGNFGARMLIIVFGLALVILGSAPIRHEYGGVMNFVKAKTQVFASELSSAAKKLRSSDFKMDRSETSSPETVQLDRITPKDRKALNKLIDKL